MKKNILATLLSIALSQLAFAQLSTTTANLQSTASVSSTCVITGGSINFGTINTGSSTVTSTGSITTRCTNNTSYNISFSSGSSGNQLARSMTGGASNDTLKYNIYTDSTYQTIIGDGQAGTSHPLTGTTRAHPVTNGKTSAYDVYVSDAGYAVVWSIFGMVASNQYVTPDNYSDNLTITLTY